jgi:hypothetical protein
MPPSSALPQGSCGEVIDTSFGWLDMVTGYCVQCRSHHATREDEDGEQAATGIDRWMPKF